MHTNPILYLAGATASVGCRMFAETLLAADTGSADAQRIADDMPPWAGIYPIDVGMILDSELKMGEEYVPPTVDLE